MPLDFACHIIIMKTYYQVRCFVFNESECRKVFPCRLHDSLLLPVRGASIIAGVDEILDSLCIFFRHFGLSVNGDFPALRRIRSRRCCWLVCYSRAFCLLLAASDALRQK